MTNNYAKCVGRKMKGGMMTMKQAARVCKIKRRR